MSIIPKATVPVRRRIGSENAELPWAIHGIRIEPKVARAAAVVVPMLSQAPHPTRSDVPSLLPSDDRRSCPRFHLQLAITLQGDNNFYTGVTADISTGGLFIATSHLLPVGTPVRLQFHIKRFDADLTASGTVRWVREPSALARGDENFHGGHFDEVKAGMGIQFEGLSERDAKLIQAFMAVRAPEFFD
jgi:uncharacterized protein (TIGR02266 family)